MVRRTNLDWLTNLQRHQQALPFHIWETEVHTAWVAIGITVSHNMLNFRIDFLNQPIGELFDMCVISLWKKEVRFDGNFGHSPMLNFAQNPCTNITAELVKRSADSRPSCTTRLHCFWFGYNFHPSMWETKVRNSPTSLFEQYGLLHQVPQPKQSEQFHSATPALGHHRWESAPAWPSAFVVHRRLLCLWAHIVYDQKCSTNRCSSRSRRCVFFQQLAQRPCGSKRHGVYGWSHQFPSTVGWLQFHCWPPWWRREMLWVGWPLQVPPGR